MSEPTAFVLPKRPRIKEKETPPDQRKVAVVPIRALTDKQVTDAAFRVLSVLCSYCNRAGITWVSQKRLAQDMSVSQQAISKQLKALGAAGYVEITRKGFRGERNNTLRVIFDPTLTAEDAIAMTSNKEDTRPPSMQDKPDPDGQARIAQMIAKAFKQPTKPKGFEMPAGNETRAVKQMKEEIAKAKAKRSKAVNKPVDNKPTFTTIEVVHGEASHTQPGGASYTTSEVVRNTEEHSIDKVKSKVRDKVNNKPNVLNNLELIDFDKLIDVGMQPEEIERSVEFLLPLFAAEGIKPTSRVLHEAILQMHKDAR